MQSNASTGRDLVSLRSAISVAYGFDASMSTTVLALMRPWPNCVL